MSLFLPTLLTMIAFAANSVLTRAAVDGGFIGPEEFAVIRVLSGAVVLCLLVLLRTRRMPALERRNVTGALCLTAYMIGFTLAYRTLDAGLGALLLFGTVQIVMFLHAYFTGAALALRQIAGSAIAFAGLLVILWPGAGPRIDPAGAALMVGAGIGWAFYTVSGRGAHDPLAATGANFLLCLPVVALLLPVADMRVTQTGIGLALVSGALTSGLGYALWYSVLPRLRQGTAAVVQLSVPVIAILAGVVLLGETLSAAALLAVALVIGGIALAVSAAPARADRRAERRRA
ncbi:DMT family transporter [Sulfitobacter sp. LCG007]